MEKTDSSASVISKETAKTLALEHYGIRGNVSTLAGEDDFNFYLKSDDDLEYTLKVSRPETKPQNIDFQHAIISFLTNTSIPVNLPEVVYSRKGQPFVELEQRRFLRLQKWVPGNMLSEINPRPTRILENWGKVCGLLSAHLSGFDHPAAHRFYKWNPSETLYSKKFRQHIHQKDRLELADYFWQLFETRALPHLPGLRKSVNYNDAHSHNLLVNDDLRSPQITGVIDFGDALYTETINELAIACAYACMDLPDPLEAAKHLVKAYHRVFPLQEKELEVLFSLIGARLMISVANAAWNKIREPDNTYLVISEKPAWELLKKLRNIPPDFAHFTFRQACGLEPCPLNSTFKAFLETNRSSFAQVIDLGGQPIAPVDLSIGSLQLGNNSNFDNIKSFQKTIKRMLEDKEAEVGIGGYGEVRPFYTTDAYQTEGNSGIQWRTVHLGIDVWAGEGTPLFAPLDGTVHSFHNNTGNRNYGPTIILEHRIPDELTFYTLYGHLSPASLDDGLSKGKLIRKGEVFAMIGAPPENGNWPPHLHFQVMLNMLNYKGDFPGVAFPHESETWLSICPSPETFFSGTSLPVKHKSTEEILDIRKSKLGKSLSISYTRPLHIVRGYMQYLYDHTGRRYLDTVNNVPHVGHQHPRVVKAARDQLALLNTNTRYLHENIILFAEELLATFPPELCVVHFVNSGSEANELAMRMIRACNGQKDMVAIEVGYHGNTGGCISVSSYKFDGKGGKGSPPHTHVVPIPDTYRGRYKSDPDAGEKYAAHVRSAIEKVQVLGRNIGGFIGESILSCGGQIVLPEGYLKAVYQYIRAAGGLCIADEVQVGFGRVGEHFWGFELQGVVPDIVTVGKPIGNGHPLAAVVTTRKVADAFANGMEYFNTFGGNPVSCAIGREVLQIIKDENLQRHAKTIGNYLVDELRNLQSRYPLIGDVRGHGLFLGFELVKDHTTLEPAFEQAAHLANRMRERGILMSTDGPYHNVLKIKPPLCFDRSNAGFLLENLDKVLSEDFLKNI